MQWLTIIAFLFKEAVNFEHKHANNSTCVGSPIAFFFYAKCKSENNKAHKSDVGLVKVLLDLTVCMQIIECCRQDYGPLQ